MISEGAPTGVGVENQAGHHHSKKEERFFRALRTFPSEAQELVTSLSSMFIEPDVYKAFRADPTNISKLQTELKSFGLVDQQVGQVMHFFNLSSKPKQKEFKK